MRAPLHTTGLALLAVALLGPGSAALAAHDHAPREEAPRLSPTLMGQFEAAAAEWGVPTSVLVAVSHSAGQWFPIEGEGAVHARKEAGHMGLRNWGDGGPSAELGAELTGASVEAVLSDPVENLRAGAALLAYFAEEANGAPVSPELDVESADAWWQAVSQYAGADTAIHGDLFASRVFHGVETGLEAVNPRNGEWIHTDARTLPVNLAEWSGDAEVAWANCRAAAERAGTSDYSGAEWYGACSGNYANYSRTASSISFVIIHVAEGSYQGTLSWFQNCAAGVSAHYTVSKYGDVGQSVREEDVAYHAGNWDYNLASVGIEHEGYTYTASTWTDAMYRASAALTKDICNRNGISKSRTYIIGHNEVPGCSSSGGGGAGCHTDPGPYFDWSYYMSLVGGSGGGGGSTPTPPPSSTKGNMVGIIAAGDIYTGPRIPGASVSISGGGSDTADSNGYYSFSSLSAGEYTVTASASGYTTASRTCPLVAGIDNWCSVALNPTGSGGGGGEEPLPTGCDERSMPRTLTATASTTGSHTLPFTAMALLLGFGIRPLIRRRRR